MGKAMMGTGEAEGENRATRAAEAAISNPLLEDTSMAGARGLLINITGGDDMTLFEVDQAANRVRQEVADDANIIFGSAVDESLSGKVRVSVVATGIDMGVNVEAKRPQLVAVGNGGMIQAVSTGFVPQASAAVQAPAAESRFAPTPMLVPRQAPVEPAPAPMAEPAYEEAPAPVRQNPFRPVAVQPPAARPMQPVDEYVPPPVQAPAPVPTPGPVSAGRSLFGMMTRSIRRSTQPEPTEPQRAEPSFSPDAAPTSQQPHYNGSDDALEIPAFLRRQSSGKE